MIPEANGIEVHRGPAGNGYQERTVVSGPVRLDSTSIAGFSVALADLFPSSEG